MNKIKKILCFALVVILTSGALFYYIPSENVAARVRAKKATSRSKSSLTPKQMADYKTAVTAVVVLERGLMKYNMKKPENLAYAKTKAAIARAAVSRVIPGSSKNGLFARVIVAEKLISNIEDTYHNIPNYVTVKSFENLLDVYIDEGSEYDLPKMVYATMSDKSTRKLEVNWDKAIDTSKIGEVLLTGRVKGTNKTVPLRVIVRKVDFGLKSVIPLNLKQVKIEFTKPVADNDIKVDIEDEENYTLYNWDKDEVDDVIEKVRLDRSNRFAIITFKDKLDDRDRHYIIENQEKYTLRIDKNVFGREIKENITFKDLTLPRVENVEVVGEDTIKVKFSEPIKPYNLEKICNNKGVLPELDRDDFEINEGYVSIRRVELINDNTAANIIINSRLKDGEKVRIKLRGTVHDYAGLSVISIKEELMVRKDDMIPEVVGFKDIDSDEVTLIFNKDIRFRGTDAIEISKNYNSYYLDDFYHSNDNRDNEATKATINGNELRLQFENSNLPNGIGYIYIRSNSLESKWNVKNDKISAKVIRNEDNSRPELLMVEQEKDASNKIKIKFSKKMNLSEYRDGGARKIRNYTLEDDNGREWRINKIVQNGDSKREFIIYTSKDLKDILRYELTVENVEDSSGNTIRKVTKNFEVKDVQPVKIDDIKVTLHNAGEYNQSIIIDFDSKMIINNDKYSVLDLGKYTLMAYETDGKTPKKFFDDGRKSAVNAEDLYKSSISSIKNRRAVEIMLPYRNRRIEDSYNLSKIPILKVEIGKVSNDNGNVNASAMRLIAKNTEIDKDTWIGFDVDPETISLDEIHWIWNDDVRFDMDDIKIVAANNSKDAEKLANLSLKGELNRNGTSKDVKDAVLLSIRRSTTRYTLKDYTEVTIGLEKQGKNPENYDEDDYHVLTYDGKFIDNDGSKKPIYMVVVPSQHKNHIDRPATENDYNIPIKLGAFKIKDAVAPAIVNNDKREINHRYKGYNKDVTKQYGSTDIRDEAVEVWQNGEHAVVVLTFEENIDTKTLSTSTFELNDKDTDFGDARINRVFAKENRVILELLRVKNGDKPLIISEGAEITQKNSFNDENDNEVNGLNLQVGEFKNLTKEDVKELGIITLDHINKVVVGKNAKLPQKVIGVLSDGSKIEKPVKWLGNINVDSSGVSTIKAIVDGIKFNVVVEIK